MKKPIIKSLLVKNILSVLAVTIFGFILLILTFILDALYQGAIRQVVMLFITLEAETNLYWYPPLMHASFVIVIGIISWQIFKSKLNVLYKATFMTVPIAVVFATIGMFLYKWPVAVYSIGTLFGAGVLYYLYHNKQHWLYYYVIVLVGLMLGIFTLLGGEI